MSFGRIPAASPVPATELSLPAPDEQATQNDGVPKPCWGGQGLGCKRLSHPAGVAMLAPRVRLDAHSMNCT